MCSTHMQGGRVCVKASLLDQPHHQKCGAIEECAVNVAELSWPAAWSRHTHHLSYAHTAHWSSTPCTQQEKWLYTWTSEALSEVMPCSRFYCSPSPTMLFLARLQWSLCGPLVNFVNVDVQYTYLIPYLEPKSLKIMWSLTCHWE